MKREGEEERRRRKRGRKKNGREENYEKIRHMDESTKNKGE